MDAELEAMLNDVLEENKRLRVALKPARDRLEHDYCDEGTWLDAAVCEIVQYADEALAGGGDETGRKSSPHNRQSPRAQ